MTSLFQTIQQNKSINEKKGREGEEKINGYSDIHDPGSINWIEHAGIPEFQ